MRRELLEPPAPREEFLPTEADHGRGCESISEWTGELGPDNVEDLQAARKLEPVYPLLHALVGRSPRDFFVRAAVIEALVRADRASLRSGELSGVLYWLEEGPRDALLRSLRQAGWLEYDPARGTTITDAGRWVYDVLAFLHRRTASFELKPTVEGVEYALRIGLDPVRHLQSMRSRLVALKEELEAALLSHSEVILRRAARRIEESLALSAQIRAALDRVPSDRPDARRVARGIHDLLSRLHRVGADLQAAITAVGRQQLRLTAGMTVEQIVRALMRRSREELAGVARHALLPVLAAPPLLTTEVVAAAAEQQFAKERPEATPVKWNEPPEAPRSEEAAEVPPEVEAWLAELAEIERGGQAVPLASAVPTRDAAGSFLRLSLLCLAGDGREGTGVAGRLGALDLEVAAEGSGWPEPLPAGPLAELTPGEIEPRKEGC